MCLSTCVTDRCLQVKQLLYGPARRQRLGIDANLSAAALEQEQETALLSELAEGDFSADENIVEVSMCVSFSEVFSYFTAQ